MRYLRMFGWLVLGTVGLLVAGMHFDFGLVPFLRWLVGGTMMYVGIVRYDREFTK